MDQDAGDEPASALMRRIAVMKGQLPGALKKRNKSQVTFAEPFAIPANWVWSRLDEVGIVSPRNVAPDDVMASFVPMTAVSAEYGVPNLHEIRAWGEIKSGYTHFAEGDVGLAKITPCFENGKSTVFRDLAGGIGAGTTELHVVRPVLVNSDYVLAFLKSPHFLQSGIPQMTGTAGQKRVPTEYFAFSPFPVPPTREQHRIVAKVAELMALCDRLEAAQAERERLRVMLLESTLARAIVGERLEGAREAIGRAAGTGVDGGGAPRGRFR